MHQTLNIEDKLLNKKTHWIFPHTIQDSNPINKRGLSLSEFKKNE